MDMLSASLRAAPWMTPKAPVPGLAIPIEDAADKREFSQFVDAARDLGLVGGVVDARGWRTVEAPGDCHTVVQLGAIGEHLAFFLGGGSTDPGSVLLATNPSWLEVKDESLWLKQGYWYDGASTIWLDTFDPPRRVTYFANFLTAAAAYGRDDGVPLESGHNTPMSSSSKLESWTGDKVHTRSVLFSAGLSVPPACAFVRQHRSTYVTRDAMTIVPLGPEEIPTVDAVKNAIDSLVAEYGASSIVIKPSGELWCGSAGVLVARLPEDLDKAVAHALDLGKKMSATDGILVEVYMATIRPQVAVTNRSAAFAATWSPKMVNLATSMDHLVLLQAEQDASQDDKPSLKMARWPFRRMKTRQAFRLRVVVARSPAAAMQDSPWRHQWQVIAKVAAVGGDHRPLHGVNSNPNQLESVLASWGFSEQEAGRLINIVEHESVDICAALSEWEDTHREEIGAPMNHQSDVFGLDLVLVQRGGAVFPVCIEVNDHDSLYAATLADYPGRGRGAFTKPWVEHALMRSQMYLMQGKKLLLVGGGGYSKLSAIEAIVAMGVHLTVVDQDESHACRKFISAFHHVPSLENHIDDARTAAVIVEAVKDTDFDGVLCLWEDATVVAAHVREALGLDLGVGKDAQMAAKNKTLTQSVLWNQKDEVDWRPRGELVASNSHSVSSVEEFERIIAEGQIDLPLVVKIPYGSSAVGVKVASTMKDASNAVKEMLSLQAAGEDHHPGAGLGFGSSTVLVMPFLVGSEHDVDVLVDHGRVVYTAISDNGPTRLPRFAETCSCMPTLLSPEHARELTSSAVSTVLGLGLHTGVFNVEMKFSSTGAKLVEVNGRMGGFYLRDWNRDVYGFDILAGAVSIAVGIRAFGFGLCKPSGYLVGLQLYTSIHGLSDEKVESVKKAASQDPRIRFSQLEPHVPEVEVYEEPFGTFAVLDSHHTSSLEGIRMWTRALELGTTEDFEHVSAWAANSKLNSRAT